MCLNYQRWILTQRRGKNHAILLTLIDEDYLSAENMDFDKEKSFERNASSCIINFKMTMRTPGLKSLMDLGSDIQ